MINETEHISHNLLNSQSISTLDISINEDAYHGLAGELVRV